MDGLHHLATRYRSSTDFVERLRLAEELFSALEPQLLLFVLSKVPPDSADDVLQETLRAMVVGLDGFNGASDAALWSWSYGITRRKIADHFRNPHYGRMTLLAPEEIAEFVEASEAVLPLAAGERADLEYALNLLDASKPECRELLWSHYVLDMDYGDIAETKALKYDAVRMRVGRCLEEARALMA